MDASEGANLPPEIVRSAGEQFIFESPGVQWEGSEEDMGSQVQHFEGNSSEEIQVLQSKLDKNRATQALSERTIVDLQDELQKESKENNELREKVAALGLELNRVRRGHSNIREVDALKQQIATLKAKHEQTLKKKREEFEEKVVVEVEKIRNFYSRNEETAAKMLLEEQKKRSDAMKVLEWENGRHKELIAENDAKFKEKLDRQRVDYEERLMECMREAKVNSEKEMANLRVLMQEKCENELKEKDSEAVQQLERAKKDFESRLADLVDKQPGLNSRAKEIQTYEDRMKAREESWQDELALLKGENLQLKGTVKTLEDYIKSSVRSFKDSSASADMVRNGHGLSQEGTPEKKRSRLHDATSTGKRSAYHRRAKRSPRGRQHEQEHDRDEHTSQTMLFFRTQSQKARSELSRVKAEKKQIEQTIKALHQDNSIWAQDVERLKSALNVMERRFKKIQIEYRRALGEISYLKKEHNNLLLVRKAQDPVRLSDSFDEDKEAKEKQQKQVSPYQTVVEKHLPSAGTNSRVFGLGISSYAEAAKMNKSAKGGPASPKSPKKRAFEPAEAATSPMNSSYITRSSDASVNNDTDFSSPFAKEGLNVDDLVVKDMNDIRIILAKPRDICTIEKKRLTPKSRSPRKVRKKSSPSSSRLAFGAPADLPNKRDSHHRAHPHGSARIFFSQQSKRSKLSTNDDVAAAERRRQHYRFPVNSDTSAQTPPHFSSALSVLEESSALVKLEEEKKRREDILQVLEWERVRHNGTVEEEKAKYEALLESQKRQMIDSRIAREEKIKEEATQALDEKQKAWEEQMNGVIERTEESAEESMKRAQNRFSKSRQEFEKKAREEKDRLKRALEIRKTEVREAQEQQSELLSLVQELEIETGELKKKNALTERQAELAKEALSYEREATALANESVEETSELMDVVQQLEYERDDARRRFAIAQEALKRERRKYSPGGGKHWKPAGGLRHSPNWKSGLLQGKEGHSPAGKKKNVSPFLRRGAQKQVRKLASGRFGSVE